MKECPFCNEQIQNEALKCRYCWEWLTEKEVLSKTVGEFQSAPSQEPPCAVETALNPWSESASAELTNNSDHKVRSAQMNPQELTKPKFIFYSLKIPFYLPFFWVMTGFACSKLFGENAATFWVTLLPVFIMYSIWLSGYVYRFRAATSLIMLSSINLLVFAIIFLMMSPLGNLTLIKILLPYAAGVSLAFIVVPKFIIIPIFKNLDLKYQFVELQDVRRERDPVTQGMIEQGICSGCGEKQIIRTKSRGFKFISAIKAKYFCESCGLFMHGNPLVYFIINLIGLIGCAPVILSYITGSDQPMWLLFWLIMALLGWKKYEAIINALRGVRASKRLGLDSTAP